LPAAELNRKTRLLGPGTEPFAEFCRTEGGNDSRMLCALPDWRQNGKWKPGNRNFFAILKALLQSTGVTQPLALVLYEKLLPGSRLVNRLQDAGYRVLTVPAADTLVASSEQEKPMIALVDLSSAHADIPQVIRRLRENASTNHIPVIAFADEKESQLQKAARDAGATLVVNDAAILTHLEPFLEQALRVD